MKKLFFTIIICSFIFSCTSLPQPMSSVQPGEKYEELGQGQCNSCSFLFFNLIPIAWDNMPARAYRCAVQSRGGDDLIEPIIQESWYYVVIGSVRCTKISGMVIKKK